jgi:hypothetical protein
MLLNITLDALGGALLEYGHKIFHSAAGGRMISIGD